MHSDSVVGQEGFIEKNFVPAWEVIGNDVHRAILSFFGSAKLRSSIIAISILFNPKVQFSQQLSEFRPISLCNFINKVFSRILVD